MNALNTRAFAFKNSCFVCLSAIALFFWACPLSAAVMDAEQWNITADKIVHYDNPPSVIAEGNVVLEKKESAFEAKTSSTEQWDKLLGENDDEQDDEEGRELVLTEQSTTTIKADWLVYDVNMGQAKLRGNIFIDIKGDTLEAESGFINLKDATGTFENATIVRQDDLELHLEGRVVEKTGELTYRIEDGWIITCKLEEGQTPPWSFGAADTKITDGGYAHLKHAVFRIKGIPVFYSPYMILPAKRERQTGFLFPSFALSDKDGFGVETPFFINLSPYADITLYPRYMTERGLMLGGEFRYATDEDSKGMLMAHYLDDSLSDPSEESYYREGHYSHTNQERYWIRGKIDQNIGEWVTRVDLDIVSDKDYLRDLNFSSTDFDANNGRFRGIFGRGFEQKYDVYRENSIAYLRSFGNGTALYGDFLAINDVSDTHYGQSTIYDEANDREYSVFTPSKFWKLPSLTYAGLTPLWTSPADFSWNAGYTNFWRDKGVSAQRFDIFPEISTHIPINRYLESTLRGGARETFYAINDGDDDDWKNEDSANRGLYRLGGDIGTTLLREYGAPDLGEGWSHTIRPFVEYEYINIADTDALPLFDPVDEIEEANTFYYGIHNFFSIFEKVKKADTADDNVDVGEEDEDAITERDLAFFKVRQGYDMRSEMSDKPLTPIEFKTGLYPVKDSRLTYKTLLDVYGEGWVKHDVEASYTNSRGDKFGLDYRYDKELSIDSISGNIWLELPYDFAFGYSIERSLENKLTIEEVFHLVYQPACWSVDLVYDYEPDDKTVMLIFRLANIGWPLGLDIEQ